MVSVNLRRRTCALPLGSRYLLQIWWSANLNLLPEQLILSKSIDSENAFMNVEIVPRLLSPGLYVVQFMLDMNVKTKSGNESRRSFQLLQGHIQVNAIPLVIRLLPSQHMSRIGVSKKSDGKDQVL